MITNLACGGSSDSNTLNAPPGREIGVGRQRGSCCIGFGRGGGMKIPHLSDFIVGKAARIGRRQAAHGELDADLRRVERTRAEKICQMFEIAAIGPEWKRDRQRHRRIMAAPALVDAEHDRLSARMKAQEIPRHQHFLPRAAGRRPQRDEAQSGGLGELGSSMKVRELPNIAALNRGSRPRLTVAVRRSISTTPVGSGVGKRPVS